ncbi:MAG: hypothetical protein AAGJ18_15110 [Bacteroidota bacterium]
MRLFAAFLLVVGLYACQSNTASKEQSTDKTVATTEPAKTTITENYCYVLSFGHDPKYQDTTQVNLTIMGDNITGIYNWIPAEKDSARGTLTGTKKGDIITVLYDYTIEGSKQKEEMIFKMEANQLLIKRGELHEVGGVLKLKNPETAEFSEAVPRITCP